MNEETRTLITYRLDRAREALAEAKLLLERNRPFDQLFQGMCGKAGGGL